MKKFISCKFSSVIVIKNIILLKTKRLLCNKQYKLLCFIIATFACKVLTDNFFICNICVANNCLAISTNYFPVRRRKENVSVITFQEPHTPTLISLVFLIFPRFKWRARKGSFVPLKKWTVKNDRPISAIYKLFLQLVSFQWGERAPSFSDHETNNVGCNFVRKLPLTSASGWAAITGRRLPKRR